jgi:hypothetical protein
MAGMGIWEANISDLEAIIKFNACVQKLRADALPE